MSLIFRDATAQEQQRAIELALSLDNPYRSSDPSIASKFRTFLRASGLDVTWCLIIAEDHCIIGSCLGVDMPGRTAMIFVSPCPTQTSARNVLITALEELKHRSRQKGIVLLQALIGDHDIPQRQVLQAAGFTKLAKLRYLELPIVPDGQLPLDSPAIQTCCYGTPVRERFLKALLETYIGSLDCPELQNIRNVEDILETHRSTGIHDPQLWHLASECETGEDVGLLLLTRTPLRSAMEIVYVGLRPKFRKRGYARALVNLAIAQTRQCGIKYLTLAVDTRNHDADKLYRSYGFTQLDLRTAWIHSLNDTR